LKKYFLKILKSTIPKIKEDSRGGPRNGGEDVLSTLDAKMRKLRTGATRNIKMEK
jgi:hypothetical protein